MANASLTLWVDIANNNLMSGWGSNSIAPQPTFKVGDNVGIELHLVRRSESVATGMDEMPTAGSTFKVAVGKPDSTPSAGTWDLAYGGEVIELPYNVSAQVLEDAINEIVAIQTDGGVTVGLVNSGTYRISFVNKTPISSAFTVDATDLFPTSTVVATQVKVGAVGVRSVWHIKIAQTVVAYQASWVAQDPASTTVDVISANTSRITINPIPKDGFFTATFNGTNSCIVGVNYSDATLLPFLPTGYTVKKSGAYSWDITAPVPLTITTDDSGLISFDSLYGELSFNNTNADTLLNGTTGITATLEVEMTTGTMVSTILQVPCRLVADLIDQYTYEPIPFDSPATEQEVIDYINAMAVRYDASQSLTSPQQAQARTNISAIGTSDLVDGGNF